MLAFAAMRDADQPQPLTAKEWAVGLACLFLTLALFVDFIWNLIGLAFGF